ncbi:hypothetical protein [Paracnuella aquatica]|uniref:hypothetical protein n=1 Tax=Paracnuella aquatica TaxID=2268757 RepID=UPI000DEF562B|nr:hypothetical protein [Paracnuella aquatica]
MHHFIDSNTGTLLINKNIHVDRAIRPQDIVLLFGQDLVQIRELGNGWSWYMVNKVSDESPLSNLLFIFQGNSLKQINFLLSDLPARSASWEEWSEENELGIQRYLDDKLTECLGADRHFVWGNIGSFYDGKGGASTIVMRYS